MFRFRWIPFVAAIVVAAIGIALGQWQTRRAHEKEAIEALMRARSAAAPLDLNVVQPLEDGEYWHTVVRGQFIPDWPLYLDNRPHNGIAGFYLLMPFRIAGTDQNILVARGWIPRNQADRTKLPAVPTPQGMIELQGELRRNVGHVMELGSAPPLKPHAIVQNADPADVSRASGLKLAPLLLEQLNDTQDGLVRDWPRPSSGVEKHRCYAFQWYGLAATVLIFFVVTGFRRGTN
jgi:cytochrome oxidase assembly protein ShyY1